MTPTEGYSCVVEANTLTGMPWRTMLLEDGDGPSASKQERLNGEKFATRHADDADFDSSWRQYRSGRARLAEPAKEHAAHLA